MHTFGSGQAIIERGRNGHLATCIQGDCQGAKQKFLLRRGVVW